MPNLGILIGNGLVQKMNCKVVKCAMKGEKLLWLWSICMICLALGSCMPEVEDYPRAEVTDGGPGSRSYVDLGLSVKWANCNVGAEAPWEYGDYYCWGETEVKDAYFLDNYEYYYEDSSNDVGYAFTLIDSEIGGSYNWDAALANWGYEWRMPTFEEMEELVNYCSWRWTSVRGKKGYMVTGPNGNSIFLPAAGNRNGYEYEELGYSGYYWTGSSAYDFGNFYGASAYILGFDGGEKWDMYYAARSWGFSVRPVYKY